MSFAELVAAVDRAAIAAFGDKDGNGEPVPVTYAPAVGSPASVTGIFSEQYVLAKGTADAGVEAIAPSVFLRLDDLPTDPEDDEPTLTIRGVAYRVIERQPDGLGGILLGLRKVT